MSNKWPAEWTQAPLGEVADFSWGNTSVTKASYVDHGTITYSASGPDGFLPYTEYDRIGIVVSAIGAECGATWLAKGKWSCIKNTMRFWSMVPEVDTCFLYWLTRDKALWPKRGSAQPFIAQADARAMTIAYPSLAQQQAIAETLGALDDKIKLNQRMNATLEAMAQTLFKEWFIDGAKEDWEEMRLEEVADVNWGDTNVTKRAYRSSGYPAYSASGPDGFLPYHDYDRTGIVVSAIGANAGMTWLAMSAWSCIKNTLRIWSIKDEISTEYLFYALQGREIWPLRGTAQPFISQGDARSMKIKIPADRKAAKFGQLVRPLHEKMVSNELESRSLSELRDMLLPKLMRGEVRVDKDTKI